MDHYLDQKRAQRFGSEFSHIKFPRKVFFSLLFKHLFLKYYYYIWRVESLDVVEDGSECWPCLGSLGLASVHVIRGRRLWLSQCRIKAAAETDSQVPPDSGPFCGSTVQQATGEECTGSESDRGRDRGQIFERKCAQLQINEFSGAGETRLFH